MDSYFKMTVRQNLVGNRIVEILGVRRVYGEYAFLAQVFPSIQILGCDFLWNLFRLSLHLGRELVRKTVF